MPTDSHKNEIMRLISQRAAAYVPEWNLRYGGADAGAAIAELFAELYGQTLDRRDAVSDKYYIELLRLLGVFQGTEQPAFGYLQFFPTDNAAQSARVPAGTEVFSSKLRDSVIFTTERAIDVTPAKIIGMFYADSETDTIEQLDPEGEEAFFSPSGNNLQRHRFTLAFKDALNVTSPCSVFVRVQLKSSYLEPRLCAALAAPDVARWSYVSGGIAREFTSAEANGNIITLSKGEDGAFDADENGRVRVYCDVVGAYEPSGALICASAQSELAAPAPADSLSNGDVPLNAENGGYCFGRRPSEYELFYIRSDQVFSKRGARARILLDMSFIAEEPKSNEPLVEFGRRLIDKTTAVKRVPDDVFVSEITWEYYNGVGWKRLAVSGAENPFSGELTGAQELFFTIPPDISLTNVNADIGYYIRARVVHVENFLSIYSRRILPLVKQAVCGYHYTDFVRAEYIAAENNLERAEIQDTDQYDGDGVSLYEPLYGGAAVYIAFDKPIAGMPMSLMFAVSEPGAVTGKLLFSVSRGGRFEQIRAIDNTDGLKNTGAVLLYIGAPAERLRLFGRDAYWLSVSRTIAAAAAPPLICGVYPNVVAAGQYQRASEQFFSAEEYEPDKALRLLERPVWQCEVYVREKGSPEEASEPVWRQWLQTEALIGCGEGDEVFELDAFNGQITFGDGLRGKVPPKGELNIRVNYSYGGGERGNLPEGMADTLVGSLDSIGGVKNISPMSGGAGRPTRGFTQYYGNKRFKHRFVPVSLTDFEEIVTEKFSRAAHTACFKGVDAGGSPAPGHVTLVVAGRGLQDESVMRALCRDIYAYLKPRCSAALVSAGRLSVVPSVLLTINSDVTVSLFNPDGAEETQAAIESQIDSLINKSWARLEIGSQVKAQELFSAVSQVENVEAVTRVVTEAVYTQRGRRRVLPLADAALLPFATVKSGRHIVRISG